ncbi:MAG: OmpA family protein [Flavobacteriales bacterium]|nr:OmpA family protein [Flavobacteriales bacterium]
MNKSFIVIIVLIGLSVSLFGQDRKEILGQKYFEEYSYDRAIKYFEAVKEKDCEIYRKLAISYYKLQDYDQSEWYYTQVVSSDDVEVEDMFNYSQVLAIQEKYPESVRWMTRYHEQKSSDTRAAKTIKDPEYYLDLIKEDNGYVIRNLEINSDEQDFGTNFYKDDIVFTSSRTGLQTVVRKWNWNQLGFLDVYKANLDTGNYELSSPIPHHRKFNKKFHEGPASFDESGEIMVFTRNNYKGRNDNGEVTLELYESRLEDGTWTKPKPFPFNDNSYSTGHGSLSQDGNVLYFVSDMPGGYGGTDIYRCNRLVDGSWSEPELLNDGINTEGNEMFPFIHPDSVLFFASNGHPGLGGLDVYYNDIRYNGLNRTTNLNAPINSSKDDFAFILNEEKNKGFFSSNRIGGMGDDDIYAFDHNPGLKFNQLLRGKVIDEIGQIVPNVKILLFNEEGAVIGDVTTADDGEYLFEVEEGTTYSMVAQKEEYSKGLGMLSTNLSRRDYEHDLMIRRPDDPLSIDKPIDMEAENLELTDDIFVIKEVDPNAPGLSLHSMVRDIRDGSSIGGAEVYLYDKMTGEEILLISPETGDNTWYLEPDEYSNKRYSVKVVKSGYYPLEFDFDTPDDELGQHKFLARLIPIMGPEEEMDLDMSDLFTINPIYFDLDKYNIRPDAQIELDKVVQVMKKYPSMVIELTSHTDCRASKKYNERLSNNRARSTAKYLRDRILNDDRITGKGLGEIDLVNDCECEGKVKSDCSEEEHQRNRRTEFRIVKM